MEGQTFSISQAQLGAPLNFEPAMGSIELDTLIDSYIAGPASLQQKRAHVSLDFLNFVGMSAISHPISRRYHVPSTMRLETQFKQSPSTVSLSYDPSPASSPAASKSLKRSRQASADSDSSTKRMPGFSIMTRDGVDITEYASRGPKTKEQRDHAALMRKLKACGSCKRSKQRCDPSHHGIAGYGSPANTPNSAVPSLTSASSWRSPVRSSQASISPQSAIEESFNQSPNQKARTIAHAGEEFSPFASSGPALSQYDLAFADALLADDFSPLPLHDFDPQFFQTAAFDMSFSNESQSAVYPTDWAMWDVQASSEQQVISSNYESPDITYSNSSFSTQSSSPSSLGVTTADSSPLGQDVWDASQTATGHDVGEWVHSGDQNMNSSVGLQRNLPSTEFFDILSARTVSSRPRPQMNDYILYPESPQDGHTQTLSQYAAPITADHVQFFEGGSTPESVDFNFDGSYFKPRSEGEPPQLVNSSSSQRADEYNMQQASGRTQGIKYANSLVRPAPEAGDVQHPPLGNNGFEGRQQDSQLQSSYRDPIMNSPSSWRCENTLGYTVAQEPASCHEGGDHWPASLNEGGNDYWAGVDTVRSLEGSSNTTTSAEISHLQQGDVLITSQEVAEQVAANERWLAQRLASRLQFQQSISVDLQLRLTSSPRFSIPSRAADNQRPHGHGSVTRANRFRQHSSIRHFQTIHSRNTLETPENALRYDYRVSGTEFTQQIEINHDNWPILRQEAQIGGDTILSTTCVLPAARTVSSLSAPEQKVSYASMTYISSALEIANVPDIHLLENAITTSSGVLEQAAQLVGLVSTSYLLEVIKLLIWVIGCLVVITGSVTPSIDAYTSQSYGILLYATICFGTWSSRWLHGCRT
jgi:hypothetical protein